METLRPHAEIHVVAPDRNRSGASNSLTLERPLRPRTNPDGVICVDGTPTDCVHLALTGLLDVEPDMVVSGINNGANLGDDVLYSGTVAAAMEGRFLGLPALAISINEWNPQHLDTAARVAVELVAQLARDTLPANTILNVNVPDLPWAEIRGYMATRLGFRHRSEPVVKSEDPRNRTIYWVGAAGGEQEGGPGTDFYAVREGYVSVTPLHTDLTRYAALEQVSGWVQKLR